MLFIERKFKRACEDGEKIYVVTWLFFANFQGDLSFRKDLRNVIHDSNHKIMLIGIGDIVGPLPFLRFFFENFMHKDALLKIFIRPMLYSNVINLCYNIELYDII